MSAGIADLDANEIVFIYTRRLPAQNYINCVYNESHMPVSKFQYQMRRALTGWSPGHYLYRVDQHREFISFCLRRPPNPPTYISVPGTDTIRLVFMLPTYSVLLQVAQCKPTQGIWRVNPNATPLLWLDKLLPGHYVSLESFAQWDGFCDALEKGLYNDVAAHK